MMMHTLTVTARADDFVGVRVANSSTEDAARLIAAAPDLLDALKRVMRHVPADAGGASLGDDLYRARIAIARATGGQ